MTELHWHTDANPCLLCGLPVTPESWVGGVGHWQSRSDSPGRWVLVRRYYLASRYGHRHAYPAFAVENDNGGVPTPDVLRPIFPPRGWAGATDAELWREIALGEKLYLGEFGRFSLFMEQDGRIWELGQVGAMTPDEYPALILALQNAQVLAARLAVQA